MKKRKIDRSRKSDEKALLQDIARLNKEKEKIDQSMKQKSLLPRWQTRMPPVPKS